MSDALRLSRGRPTEKTPLIMNPSRTSRSAHRALPLALSVLGAIGLVAGPTTVAAAASEPVSVSTSVPSGTTLRVGDQLSGLQTILKSGNQGSLPFNVDWSSFLGGPPMLQAFQAGAIDVGLVGTTPTIFAQAAHQNIVAVAAYGSANSADDLVTAPGEHITSWKQLKGKKVAYQQGTVAEAVVLAGLKSAGLKLADITPVNLPVTEATPALENHSADAAVLVQPLTDGYLKQNPTASIVQVASGDSARLTYIIASKSALADPAKSAAIASLLKSIVKAYSYINTHQADFVQLQYVKQYGLTTAEGTKLIQELGKTTFVPIGSSLYAAQQAQANLFTAAGEIPTHINTNVEFDPRFNAVIAAAQKP
jgi:sulfonate transport system substrate-binding protein